MQLRSNIVVFMGRKKELAFSLLSNNYESKILKKKWLGFQDWALAVSAYKCYFFYRRRQRTHWCLILLWVLSVLFMHFNHYIQVIKHEEDQCNKFRNKILYWILSMVVSENWAFSFTKLSWGLLIVLLIGKSYLFESCDYICIKICARLSALSHYTYCI